MFSAGRDTRRIHRLMREVSNVARNSPQTISSPVASRVLVDDLVASVVELLSPGNGRQRDHLVGRPQKSRKQIVTAANERLESVGLVPVSIANLARELSVSERTLRTAFLDYFGVGPIRYQRDWRLHRVRRELLAKGASETTVTEVLSRFGIWQHGRFAGAYRKRFGELPSETLAGASRTSVFSARRFAPGSLRD